MTLTDGAVSWETVANAGEVEHDDDEELEGSNHPTSNSDVKATFQRMRLEEPLQSTKFEKDAEKHVKKFPNGADVTVRRFQHEGFSQPVQLLTFQFRYPFLH